MAQSASDTLDGKFETEVLRMPSPVDRWAGGPVDCAEHDGKDLTLYGTKFSVSGPLTGKPAISLSVL